MALILLAAGAAFHNVFANGFHLDDFYRVVGNPGIQSVHPFWRHFVDPSTMATEPRIMNYRPTLPLTLSLNYWWGGEAPAGYHAVNLAFHMASSLLVYVLLGQLAAFRRRALAMPDAPSTQAAATGRSAALIAALLFAVHPVAGIVVNYISARDLAMMQTFTLASLVCYARMRARATDSAAGWIVTQVFAALAILSKTNALALPALVLAFELIVAGARWRTREPWLRTAIFAVVPAFLFVWMRVVLQFSELENVVRDGPGDVPHYVLGQAKAHLIYLFNFVWPVNLRQMPLLAPPARWFAPPVAATLLILAGSLFAAWRLRARMPALAFCVVAYWILMVPESSVLPLLNMRADYRPYPSSAFLFGALTLAALTWLPRVVGLAAGAVAVVALAAASIQINHLWLTEETLWAHSVARGGDTVAHQNLAMAIPDRRDPRIKTLLERAISLAPENVRAHINYGFHLIELGRPDEGLREIKKGVALAPTWGQPHYWLALAHERLEQPGPAAEEALTANGLEPRNVEYAYEAGRLMQNANRPAESLEPLRAVLARNERYKDAKFLEAFALQKTGALDAAIFAYREFLTWQPDHTQAHFNLGYALFTKENCVLAIPQFERALVLRPEYREAHLYLAICYEALGNPARAAEERRLLEGKD